MQSQQGQDPRPASSARRAWAACVHPVLAAAAAVLIASATAGGARIDDGAAHERPAARAAAASARDLSLQVLSFASTDPQRLTDCGLRCTPLADSPDPRRTARTGTDPEPTTAADWDYGAITVAATKLTDVAVLACNNSAVAPVIRGLEYSPAHGTCWKSRTPGTHDPKATVDRVGPSRRRHQPTRHREPPTEARNHCRRNLIGCRHGPPADCFDRTPDPPTGTNVPAVTAGALCRDGRAARCPKSSQHPSSGPGSGAELAATPPAQVRHIARSSTDTKAPLRRSSWSH